MTYADSADAGDFLANYEPLTTSRRSAASRGSLQSTPRADAHASAQRGLAYNSGGTSSTEGKQLRSVGVGVSSPCGALTQGHSSSSTPGWDSPLKRSTLIGSDDVAGLALPPGSSSDDSKSSSSGIRSRTMRSALTSTLPRGAASTPDRYAYTLSSSSSPAGGRWTGGGGGAPPSTGDGGGGAVSPPIHRRPRGPGEAASTPTLRGDTTPSATASAAAGADTEFSGTTIAGDDASSSRRLHSLLGRAVITLTQQREYDLKQGAFAAWQENTQHTLHRATEEAAHLRRQLAGARVSGILHTRRMQMLQKTFADWRATAAAASAAQPSPERRKTYSETVASQTTEAGTGEEEGAAASSGAAASGFTASSAATLRAPGAAPCVRVLGCVREVLYFLFWFVFFMAAMFGSQVAIEEKRPWTFVQDAERQQAQLYDQQQRSSSLSCTEAQSSPASASAAAADVSYPPDVCDESWWSSTGDVVLVEECRPPSAASYSGSSGGGRSAASLHDYSSSAWRDGDAAVAGGTAPASGENAQSAVHRAAEAAAGNNTATATVEAGAWLQCDVWDCDIASIPT